MELLGICTGFVAGSALLAACFYNCKRKWAKKVQVESSILEMVESSRDIIYYAELYPTYKRGYISPSIDTFLGEGTLEQLYMNPSKTFELVHPEDMEIMRQKLSGEANYCNSIIQRLRHKDGSYHYFEEYATPIYRDGIFVAIQGIMRNIDEKMALQQSLEYEVSYDALTKIFNRRSFECQVERFNLFEDAPVAIFLCDLDNLKIVNDGEGHKKGDEVICGAARFLSDYFCEEAIVSRIGGDEFAIILYNATQPRIEALYTELPAALIQYNEAQQSAIQLSVGYAFSEFSNGMMETLYTGADAHMYEQKRAKKSARAVHVLKKDAP